MRILLLLGVLLLPAVALADDGPDAETLRWARDIVARQLIDAPQAPEFPDGRDWLNVARPLTMKQDLRGKVVILDFWCYCCINCIHVLPDLEYLETKYKDKPFAVVGVHSAKFTNEKDAANIREAVRRYEIAHPVVNDGDFRIWRGYGARSWPTFVVIAPDGRVIGRLSGEGNREELDALVQATLEVFEKQNPKLLNTKPLPTRLERDSRPPGQLAYPGAITADPKRKCLYVSDSNHNRIVQIGLDGRFQRAFGSGERGMLDGGADDARFNRPQGTCLDGDVLWVADTKNHAIRRVDLKTGAVTTAAGTGKQGNLFVLTSVADAGTPFPTARTDLNSPWDVVRAGTLIYIAMAGSHQLWALEPQARELLHIAGSGRELRLDAERPLEAALAQPSGITQVGGQLVFADSESSAIVQMALPAGKVETLAGATREPKDLFHYGDEDGKGRGRRFQHPLDVLWHDDVLYVADAYNHKIKTLDPKTRVVATFLGDGKAGLDDKTPRFAEPSGLAAIGRTLYVADTNNHAIRAIDLDTKTVTTLALAGIPIPEAYTKNRRDGEAWDGIPGTIVRAEETIELANDADASVTFRIDLPLGWKMSDLAPSTVSLEIDGLRSVAALGAGDNTFVVPSLEAGKRKAVLRALYYVCQAKGACRMRSVEIPLQVTVRKGATTPVLRDTFVP